MNKYFLVNERGLDCGVSPVNAESFQEAFKKFKRQAGGSGWEITCDCDDTAVNIDLDKKYQKVFKNANGEIL